MTESLLLDNVEKFRGKSVEYSKVPLGMTITDVKEELLVQVELRSIEARMPLRQHKAYKTRLHLGHERRKERRNLVRKCPHSSLVVPRAKNIHREIIRAKYVVGCDGAHSWTRKHFGIPFQGQHTHGVWDVMDLIPITNFPDIRKNCIIKSDHGNLLLVPRENKLVP